MATIVIRGLPLEAKQRVAAFAKAQGLDLGAAAQALIIQALDAREARQAGARAANDRPAAERSAAARKAVTARWAKTKPHPFVSKSYGSRWCATCGQDEGDQLHAGLEPLPGPLE